MITVTSVEAQNRFGELIDRAQREPVEVTRRGRTVAYVVSELDMQELMSLRQRREEAARWYSRYRRTVAEQAPAADADALTDAEVSALVHELR
ncbi:prevent-host-death protein [Thiohalocapsa halophila]|uniref:Antitoxin n=1 Tax=Thiohalocapsa halophila TaxID=69359 RepID=A0ABS1CC41_9GAMM|nr:type II toxin-antitoxin system prevent-host-death family antitoxin [Thiohalocapsa halophila]MBK1629483.1 prevent-host-death protein [Thiohalocapsa halophila]